ncbi:DNA polymerase III subunit delta' [Chitiniphilus shinanonensis]|uniref:DNA polymerase III subunit delta n=1 Tax=Chitiniphilus shinanonensis TaxID=553088 RepID=A0ABQ6BVF7_9NEIS|nr:DNA polymerase III subunit delta' [Chitiniphilus shinanonensis]GLS05698.1 DNA polymerase III subunit delta' [Chitiniphilus shinanonensis]
MNGLTLYPWQQTTWDALLAGTARMPHALLLTGEAGIGKRRFAERLAAWFLCEAPGKTSEPCGVCESCRWFAAGNHPDYRVLAPGDDADEEEEGTKAKRRFPTIGVDDVRELNDFVNLTSHRGGARVTVVYPAESLNLAAANALLKTLEEPPAGAQFILVAHHWRRLLPTIRSRCRIFPLPMPEHRAAAAWLAQHGVVDPELHLHHSGGAPLAALEDAGADWLGTRRALLEHLANPGALDVLAVAGELEKSKLDAALVIAWLQKWVYDLVSMGLAGVVRYYPDCKDDLTRLSVRAPQLLKYAERLLEAQRLAHHPLNLRLVYETLLNDYVAAFRKGR